jgi:AcrR family transcriptional regulator
LQTGFSISIARRTGIGNATLYRHFPTRDDLIEAVYRNEGEKLSAAAQRFAEVHFATTSSRSKFLITHILRTLGTC